MASQALIVRGGWDGHKPIETTEIFIPFLREQGYDVVVSDTLDSYLDEDLMGKVDLITQVWTMGELKGDHWKALNKAVMGGCGFASWHGGIIDAFRNNTAYQFMTGGQWVAHPGNCDFGYTVKITDADHEITKGIGDFELDKTEQYYCHIDPGVHVLCSTTFTGEHGNEENYYPAGTVMPYCWTRTWGKGKVFVAAWGHTDKDFDVPQARQIVERGLVWATR
jgi:type 1 glutamine amidotransferase